MGVIIFYAVCVIAGIALGIAYCVYENKRNREEMKND